MSAKVRKTLEIGGIVSGVVMLAFGIAAVAMSVDARDTVQDELEQQFIVGSADMNPDDIKQAATEAGLPSSTDLPSCDVSEEPIDTGSEARCFAEYMRIHALESSDGLTYSQMGRFVLASDPSDPRGTSDEAAAAKDESGKPLSNGARNTWVTETALSTALNVSYMAERIALFGLVVGIALMLSGIGFIILAAAVLGGRRSSEKAALPAAT